MSIATLTTPDPALANSLNASTIGNGFIRLSDMFRPQHSKTARRNETQYPGNVLQRGLCPCDPGI